MDVEISCACGWKKTYYQADSKNRPAATRAFVGLRAHMAAKHGYRSGISKAEYHRRYRQMVRLKVTASKKEILKFMKERLK